MNMFLPSSLAFLSKARIGDLAAAEHDRDFDFSAVEQEAFGHAGLGLVVVILDLRAEFDFFEFPVFLFLTSVFVFLRLLVLEPSIIADSTDRRNRGRRDFDQIEAFLTREREGVLRWHHPELRALIVDDANLADPNLVVNTQRSCYVRSPIETKKWRCRNIPHAEPTVGSKSATGSPEGIR